MFDKPTILTDLLMARAEQLHSLSCIRLKKQAVFDKIFLNVNGNLTERILLWNRELELINI